MAISDEFTHFNEEGRGRMVDVTHKKDTARMALARGAIYMKPQTLEKILSNQMKRGMCCPWPRSGALWGASAPRS